MVNKTGKVSALTVHVLGVVGWMVTSFDRKKLITTISLISNNVKVKISKLLEENALLP